MRILWLTSLCTASGWLYLLPTFTPPNLKTMLPLFIFPLTFGIIAASLSFRNIAPKQAFMPLKSLRMAIPFLPVIIFLPFPYSLGADVMLTGLFAGCASNRVKPLAPVAAGCLLTGFILLIQGAFTPVLYVFLSRYHEVGFLNQIAYPVVRLFGLNASISEGVIYIPTFENLLAFPGTWEKAGVYLLFHILVCGGILFALFDRNLKKFMKFFVCCIGYAGIRYIFMIFVYAQADDAEIYWHPLAFTLSYAPLAFVLAAVFPMGNTESRGDFNLYLPDFSKKDRMNAALFFIGMFCFVGIWGFHDPGTEKSGKILIDETRSNWEWTTRKFDTAWFGSQSTYNYYCMTEYFNHFYKAESNTEEKLSTELLSRYDILVLKTPTSAYTDQEIESIVAFVRQGGGLWLVGDHTNVFGMNYYLNFVAKRFGIFFHYDSTYDLASGRLTLYEKPSVFPHPVVQNMPPFLFATSCTVDAPLSAENIMVGYGLRSRLLAYSDKTFFERAPTSDYEFGLFLQSVGIAYGKGRVAAFTDSTCFSNFYMFIPSKPELALGTMEWLNRKNRYGFLVYIFAVMAIVSTLIPVLSAKKEAASAPHLFSLWFFSALCAAALGIVFFTYLTQKAYPLPAAHTKFKTVCFERQYSDMVLPVTELTDDHPKNYHTFYVWTQRMGYVPYLEKRLSDALKNRDMVVMINPDRRFADSDIQEIVRFVENGGRFLLLDGPRNRKSSSNQLLKAFDMEIVFSEAKDSVLYDSAHQPVCTAQKTAVVKGGSSFLTREDKESVFSVKGRGKGFIGVMSGSHLFGNPVMGGTQIVPDQTRQQIYRAEFYMIEVMENQK